MSHVRLKHSMFLKSVFRLRRSSINYLFLPFLPDFVPAGQKMSRGLSFFNAMKFYLFALFIYHHYVVIMNMAACLLWLIWLFRFYFSGLKSSAEDRDCPEIPAEIQQGTGISFVENIQISRLLYAFAKKLALMMGTPWVGTKVSYMAQDFFQSLFKFTAIEP